MAVETKTVKTETIGVKRDVYTSITEQELQDLLSDSAEKGTTFIKMFTETAPQMRKTGNPFVGNVKKCSQTVCMVGFKYENVVNNARAKEAFQLAIDYFAEQFEISKEEAKKHLESLMPKANSKVRDFKSKPRKWGKHINSILIENTGKDGVRKVYVQVWVLHSQKPTYKYLDDGKEIIGDDLSELKSFFPKKNSNAKHQGLEEKNEIIIRDYTLCNVDKIHLNKEKYAVN